MEHKEQIIVGKIVGAQGLRGEIRVQTYTESPADMKNLKFQISNLKFVRVVPNSSVVIMKPDGVDDRNAAEALRGTELFITRDALPPLPDGEYYQADLIGMKVLPLLRRGGREAAGVVLQNEQNATNKTTKTKNNTGNANTLPNHPVAFGDTPPQEGNYVAAVHNFGAGDILELDNGEMVSFAGAKVDLGKREITLTD